MLYLIRPKPPVLKVPSLSFFFKNNFQSPLISFLRRIPQDALLLLQFLALLLLAFSVADPFVMVDHEVTGQNTVLVIDASGSSQVLEGGMTRFSVAQERALELVGSRNTVIVIKEIPQVLVRDGSASEARKALENLEPTASASRVGDSILLAGELLAGKEGRIVVISDFIETSGMDALLAKSVVESKGPVVDFVTVGEQGNTNVGFVDARVGTVTTQLSIKNYDNSSKTITIDVGGTENSLALEPVSISSFTLPTPPGDTKISIKQRDDFALDNVFYLSAPSKTKVSVLYVSNNKSVFLENALLSSPGIEVTVATPPIVPKDRYDIYIVDAVDPTQVLPGTFEDIFAKVQTQGSTAVVVAQGDSPSIDYKSLLPVAFSKERGEPQSVVVEQITPMTRNMNFGRVNSYLVAQPLEGTQTVVSAGGSPLIALSQKGSGKILYFGFLQEATDFRFSPFYPIFWNEAMNELLGRTDIELLNYKVDDGLSFSSQQTIRLPDGSEVTTQALTFEVPGFYALPDRTVAVNMLNERESNVNKKEAESRSQEYELRTIVEKRPLPLELYLIIVAVAFLVLEILILKWRGDL